LPDNIANLAANTGGAQLMLGTGADGIVQLKRGSANTARRGRGASRTATLGPPSLLLRTTQEERERRITEKVRHVNTSP
jgi:hypothetical protein